MEWKDKVFFINFLLAGEVRAVCGAGQRDRLHCPEGEQPEILAVQDPPLGQAPALQTLLPQVSSEVFI